MTFSVHRLTSDETGLIRQLNAMFGEAFGDPRTYERDPPSDSWLETLLSMHHVVVLAACVGEEVAGGLVAYELPKFEQERRELYIYDLAVAERHRRKGIATALIKQLRAVARERGVWVIYVQADYGDDPAITLYEKLGVREEVLHFDIPVRRQAR